MTTISVRASVTRSSSLTRRGVDEDLVASWGSVGGTETRTATIQPQASLAISPCSVLIISVDRFATVRVGWVLSSVTTEFDVSQLAIVSPPSGVSSLYVKNNAPTLGGLPTNVTTVAVR